MKTWELRGVTIDQKTPLPIQGESRCRRFGDPDAGFVRLLAEVAGSELERREREAARRFARVRRIRDVIRLGRLTVVVQPIVDLRSLTAVGYEALGRIRGAPSRGPSWWLDEANAVGLRTRLELTAAKAALATMENLAPRMALWLNASPETVAAQGFVDLVAAGSPARTVVELTEHAVVEDYARLRANVARLRTIGVRLAIDDMGAGAATFRHVLLLRPDVIKLDRALTAGIEADPQRRALVRAMVAFTGDVGAQLTAEGIETAAQLRVLRDSGVRFGQGHLLGRPSPVRPGAGLPWHVGVPAVASRVHAEGPAPVDRPPHSS
jgi:EAL domain-containing protein (putative c-di-GMP-specific phosphodiesterase class I)